MNNNTLSLLFGIRVPICHRFKSKHTLHCTYKYSISLYHSSHQKTWVVIDFAIYHRIVHYILYIYNSFVTPDTLFTFIFTTKFNYTRPHLMRSYRIYVQLFVLAFRLVMSFCWSYSRYTLCYAVNLNYAYHISTKWCRTTYVNTSRIHDVFYFLFFKNPLVKAGLFSNVRYYYFMYQFTVPTSEGFAMQVGKPRPRPTREH